LKLINFQLSRKLSFSHDIISIIKQNIIVIIAVWMLRKQRKKKNKKSRIYSRFKVTQLSFATCKHTNAKSKFWFPSKVEIKVILHDMLTGHSLGFSINTRTVKNSTVYQAKTTSMCTVNISDHEEQHININL
jgi:hypothetical protein